MAPILATMPSGAYCDCTSGVVSVRSRYPVDRAVTRIRELLLARGAKLFAVVDHGAEALAAGYQMRPTVLLIFGDPRQGTPLMLASPGIAVDLPLKVLAWEDGDGAVWISYVAPSYLATRHHIPSALAAPLGAAERLAFASRDDS